LTEYLFQDVTVAIQGGLFPGPFTLLARKFMNKALTPEGNSNRACALPRLLQHVVEQVALAYEIALGVGVKVPE
jgi:hypothetical protein